MSDHLVTLATFHSSVEAMMAKNRLESEGVTAQVAEELTGDLFQLASPVGVRLLVAEEDIERAGAILDSHEKATALPASVPEEGISATRSCPMCGKPFGAEYDDCPNCGPPEQEEDEPADDETSLTTEEGFAKIEAGELASRALRAAIISLVVPFVYPYALWLLFRVTAYPGELSAPALRRFLGATAILALGAVAALFFCGQMVGFRRIF